LIFIESYGRYRAKYGTDPAIRAFFTNYAGIFPNGNGKLRTHRSAPAAYRTDLRINNEHCCSYPPACLSVCRKNIFVFCEDILTYRHLHSEAIKTGFRLRWVNVIPFPLYAKIIFDSIRMQVVLQKAILQFLSRYMIFELVSIILNKLKFNQEDIYG